MQNLIMGILKPNMGFMISALWAQVCRLDLS